MQRLVERIAKLHKVTGGSTCCGWMINEVSLLLYSLIKFYKPALVIQCGHLWGASALVTLEALTDEMSFGIPTSNDRMFESLVDAHRPNSENPLLVSIDPEFPTVPRAEAGIALLRNWYPTAFEFHPLKSSDFFAKYGNIIRLDDAGETIMTIIDGDHTLEGCRSDIENSIGVGASVIFVDDSLFVQVGQAARDCAAKHGYQYCGFELYNGAAVLTKKGE